MAANAGLATGSVYYNYQNAAWQLLYSARVGQRTIPSFASAIANVGGTPDTQFRVDYSVDPATIPAYPAGDVLNGAVGAKQLAGKQVVIGIGSDVIGDVFFVPGYGRSFGAYVHAIGAETLLSGAPIDLGWFLAFTLAVGAAAVALRRNRLRSASSFSPRAAAALLVVPVFLEANLIFVDITPGLFVLLVVGTVLGWRRYRSRGLVNPVSNLPNLNALRGNRDGRNKALVAARILNYEEIVATLAPKRSAS